MPFLDVECPIRKYSKAKTHVIWFFGGILAKILMMFFFTWKLFLQFSRWFFFINSLPSPPFFGGRALECVSSHQLISQTPRLSHLNMQPPELGQWQVAGQQRGRSCREAGVGNPPLKLTYRNHWIKDHLRRKVTCRIAKLLIPPGSLTAKAPENIPGPNRKGKRSSNHHFLGANC